MYRIEIVVQLDLFFESTMVKNYCGGQKVKTF